MTETQIAQAIAAHHAGREWAFLTQVRNGTGFEKRARTADAIAISTWPSRGIYATGYEIKVSKSDLKHELEQPEKADEIGKYCKYWFLAVPKGLTDGLIIPGAWGVVEVADTGKLKWAKPATENAHLVLPDWLFVASILRNIGDSMTPTVDVNRRIETALTAQADRHRKELEQTVSARELSELRKRVAAFEERSGVKMDRYSEYFNGEIGEAVNILRQYSGSGGPMGELLRIQNSVNSLAGMLSVLVDTLSKVQR